MSFNKVRLEFTHQERVARIILASPKANILDRVMLGELREALSEATAHPRNAIIIGADGPHFSFGASVQEHLPDQISRTLQALHSLLRQNP